MAIYYYGNLGTSLNGGKGQFWYDINGEMVSGSLPQGFPPQLEKNPRQYIYNWSGTPGNPSPEPEGPFGPGQLDGAASSTNIVPVGEGSSWTVVAMWDGTVDYRTGSCSIFAVDTPGLTVAQVMTQAHAAWPLNFPAVDAAGDIGLTSTELIYDVNNPPPSSQPLVLNGSSSQVATGYFNSSSLDQNRVHLGKLQFAQYFPFTYNSLRTFQFNVTIVPGLGGSLQPISPDGGGGDGPPIGLSLVQLDVLLDSPLGDSIVGHPIDITPNSPPPQVTVLNEARTYYAVLLSYAPAAYSLQMFDEGPPLGSSENPVATTYGNGAITHTLGPPIEALYRESGEGTYYGYYYWFRLLVPRVLDISIPPGHENTYINLFTGSGNYSGTWTGEVTLSTATFTTTMPISGLALAAGDYLIELTSGSPNYQGNVGFNLDVQGDIEDPIELPLNGSSVNGTLAQDIVSAYQATLVPGTYGLFFGFNSPNPSSTSPFNVTVSVSDTGGLAGNLAVGIFAGLGYGSINFPLGYSNNNSSSPVTAIAEIQPTQNFWMVEVSTTVAALAGTFQISATYAYVNGTPENPTLITWNGPSGTASTLAQAQYYESVNPGNTYYAAYFEFTLNSVEAANAVTFSASGSGWNLAVFPAGGPFNSTTLVSSTTSNQLIVNLGVGTWVVEVSQTTPDTQGSVTCNLSYGG